MKTTKVFKLLDTFGWVLNPVEGIYYSNITGKFFEAVIRKDGTFRPKYTCGGYGPKVSALLFKLQADTFYELIMEYEK